MPAEVLHMRSRVTFAVIVFFALLGTIAPAFAAPASIRPEPKNVLLRPARVFDATSSATHDGWVVLVSGEKIAAVGPAASVAAPPGTTTIDLPGMTLLPGLIDAHSHIFLHPYNETLWNDQVLHEPLAYRTIAATLHSRDTLLAVLHALRAPRTEGAGFGDVSANRAIEEGRIPGPCLFVATRPIVAPANYGPGPGGFGPGFERLTQGPQRAAGTG